MRVQPVKPFFDLRSKVHSDIKKETKLSWAWYENNVRNAASGMSVQKFLGDNSAYQINKSGIVPGQMIMFFYSPKYKDSLPLYDTFPLVLPFAISDDGTKFTGLNLHYLKPVVRAVMLEQLMKYATDDKLSYNTKIQASWSMLKKAAGDDIAKHCVKSYLFTHVKSNAIIIPPNEWKFVLWLPLERFKKGTNEQAWSV